MTSTTLGFLIALASALCWASLDISRKKLGRHMTATAAVASLMLFHASFVFPILVVGHQVTLDDSSSKLAQIFLGGFPEVGSAYFLPAIISIILNLGANFLYLRAVQISPLSLTTPYLAFTPVFTALVALIFLGEIPSNWGWLGILIVCVGAFTMNPGDSKDGLLAPLKALWTERGSFYMLLVSLLWSFTPILDKKSSGMTSPMWHTMFLAAGIGTTFMVGRLIKDRGPKKLLAEVSTIPLFVALSAMFAIGAMTFQLASYDYIDVAYMETIKRALGVFGSIMAGYFLFGERNITRRLVSAGIMCIGVAFILMAG